MKRKSRAAWGCTLGSVPVTSPSRCMRCSRSSHWPGTGRLGWCWIWCKRLNSGARWKLPLWGKKKKNQNKSPTQCIALEWVVQAGLILQAFPAQPHILWRKWRKWLHCSLALGQQEVFIIHLEPFRLSRWSSFTWTALSAALGSSGSFIKASASPMSQATRDITWDAPLLWLWFHYHQPHNISSKHSEGLLPPRRQGGCLLLLPPAPAPLFHQQNLHHVNRACWLPIFKAPIVFVKAVKASPWMIAISPVVGAGGAGSQHRSWGWT